MQRNIWRQNKSLTSTLLFEQTTNAVLKRHRSRWENHQWTRQLSTYVFSTGTVPRRRITKLIPALGKPVTEWRTIGYAPNIDINNSDENELTGIISPLFDSIASRPALIKQIITFFWSYILNISITKDII